MCAKLKEKTHLAIHGFAIRVKECIVMSTRIQYNRMKSRITNTEDRQRLLRLCIEKLTQSNKKLIQYLLSQPEVAPQELTKLFKLSYANIRTRKSRIIQALKECFLRHSKA